MIILTIRTDKPEAEVGLYNDKNQFAYISWGAHRQLAETLHTRIKEILDKNHLDWSDIQGVLVFKGPGSFTGLRIGLSVGNALAQANKIPIISSTGDRWLFEGVDRLLNGENEKISLPEYGADVYTTKPKK